MGNKVKGCEKLKIRAVKTLQLTLIASCHRHVLARVLPHLTSVRGTKDNHAPTGCDSGEWSPERPAGKAACCGVSYQVGVYPQIHRRACLRSDHWCSWLRQGHHLQLDRSGLWFEARLFW